MTTATQTPIHVTDSGRDALRRYHKELAVYCRELSRLLAWRMSLNWVQLLILQPSQTQKKCEKHRVFYDFRSKNRLRKITQKRQKVALMTKKHRFFLENLEKHL